MVDNRLITPQKTPEDEEFGNGLRPQTLSDFIGQKKACENLAVFIQAAKIRNESIDHILLYGPPGLGKTTLAQIIAHEMGVGFRPTAGPMISKAGDLAAILTSLEPHDVLFIDEIHRLPKAVEEVLYSAMEDFQLDLMIGEGPGAHSVRIDLPPFTLVGATTRSGLLTTPLRDRFGIPVRLNFYSDEDLKRIVLRAAKILNIDVTDDGALEIARRSRGTPRVSGRLLKRVRDFATLYDENHVVTLKETENALARLDIDKSGLDAMDRRYLMCIIRNYGGGPVGIDTISAALCEERDTLEEIVEPFLMQLGFLQRTPRGRVVSRTGYTYLGETYPMTNPADAQGELL